MSEIKIALRYAKSLLDLAKEQNKVDEINNDIKLFHDTVKANPQLRAVLANPIISATDKKAVLHGLFASKMDKATIAFFDLMIGKSRESYLYATSKQFGELYNQLNGIVKAEVVSASALTEGNKQQLVSTLEKELNKRVILNAKVNADLIGGFVLTVGDKQFDTSVAKQLNELKKSFMSSDFVAQL